MKAGFLHRVVVHGGVWFHALVLPKTALFARVRLGAWVVSPPNQVLGMTVGSSNIGPARHAPRLSCRRLLESSLVGALGVDWPECGVVRRPIEARQCAIWSHVAEGPERVDLPLFPG